MNESPTCVYLVYCESRMDTLASLPGLHEVFLDLEKAKEYLDGNPRPGYIEKWLVGDYFYARAQKTRKERVAVVAIKDTYDHEVIAAEEAEIKKRTQRLKEANTERKRQQKAKKPLTPNWT